MAKLGQAFKKAGPTGFFLGWMHKPDNALKGEGWYAPEGVGAICRDARITREVWNTIRDACDPDKLGAPAPLQTLQEVLSQVVLEVLAE
jgi:hypothetical protein